MVPVQKSKQSSSLSNFRPISILSAFSKVLEKVVFNQVVNHFTTHYLFSNKQSGFYSGYSTQDVLLYATDAWLKAIDNGQFVGAIFLNLAKALIVLIMTFCYKNWIDMVSGKVLMSGCKGSCMVDLSRYLHKILSHPRD